MVKVWLTQVRGSWVLKIRVSNQLVPRAPLVEVAFTSMVAIFEALASR